MDMYRIHRIFAPVKPMNLCGFGFLSQKQGRFQDNTPSMPLNDAHLGGFFVYAHG
jgi:hypothetical protein